MTTKTDRAWAVITAAVQAEAAEQGEQWFKAYPEALMIEVCREASKRFGHNDPHLRVWGFLQGFTNARQRREEYLQEQKGNQP